MMDRETIKSFASRVVDNDRVRSLAERAALYAAPPSMRARHITLLAAGVGVGALAMYLLDPEQGRRRRTRARNGVTNFVGDAERRLEARARHYASRARGVVAEAKSAVADAKSAVGGSQPF